MKEENPATFTTASSVYCRLYANHNHHKDNLLRFQYLSTPRREQAISFYLVSGIGDASGNNIHQKESKGLQHNFPTIVGLYLVVEYLIVDDSRLFSLLRFLFLARSANAPSLLTSLVLPQSLFQLPQKTPYIPCHPH
jgi:hypothetical protein